ncbi:MAG: molybdopterin-guanine dinucleotide biosynthesis protein B [Gemmatimonadetes bacterium]|nr:molybdopterin-guanine dinucleotide biosynthesis protein B [Gemmatimonadota bacterium]
MTHPAVFCVTGKKKSGKTTTTVGLVRELVSRGFVVATAKHGHHFELDREGKDSYRHRYEGGAVATVLSGPEGYAVVGTWPTGEETLDVLVSRYLSHADIVIAEGHKSSGYPRFEVYRRAAHREALYGSADAGDGEYLAVVTDVLDLVAEVPVIDANDPQRFGIMADIVETRLKKAE